MVSQHFMLFTWVGYIPGLHNAGLSCHPFLESSHPQSCGSIRSLEAQPYQVGTVARWSEEHYLLPPVSPAVSPLLQVAGEVTAGAGKGIQHTFLLWSNPTASKAAGAGKGIQHTFLLRSISQPPRHQRTLCKLQHANYHNMAYLHILWVMKVIILASQPP